MTLRHQHGLVGSAGSVHHGPAPAAVGGGTAGGSGGAGGGSLRSGRLVGRTGAVGFGFGGRFSGLGRGCSGSALSGLPATTPATATSRRFGTRRHLSIPGGLRLGLGFGGLDSLGHPLASSLDSLGFGLLLGLGGGLLRRAPGRSAASAPGRRTRSTTAATGGLAVAGGVGLRFGRSLRRGGLVLLVLLLGGLGRGSAGRSRRPRTSSSPSAAPTASPGPRTRLGGPLPGLGRGARCFLGHSSILSSWGAGGSLPAGRPGRARRSWRRGPRRSLPARHLSLRPAPQRIHETRNSNGGSRSR